VTTVKVSEHGIDKETQGTMYERRNARTIMPTSTILYQKIVTTPVGSKMTTYIRVSLGRLFP
jgi:hypothetical protein